MRAIIPFLLLVCLLTQSADATNTSPPLSVAAALPDAGLIEGAWLGPVELADPDDPLSLSAPTDLLLVIYSHGSRAEFRRDRCRPLGGTTPAVIQDLDGREVAGLRVAVFAFCTPSVLGEFNEQTGEGEPKVVKRAREIAALVARFAAAGIPPRRIVLAGQSAGGWASLLVAGSRRLPVAGVVAFAPGFAGKAERRAGAWQRLRDAQAAELAAAPYLPALVYAFAGDPFEPPADLEFLAGIRGVTLVVRDEVQQRAASPCAPHEPHLRAFTECFRTVEGSRLLDFLAERVRIAGGARS